MVAVITKQYDLDFSANGNFVPLYVPVEINEALDIYSTQIDNALALTDEENKNVKRLMEYEEIIDIKIKNGEKISGTQELSLFLYIINSNQLTKEIKVFFDEKSEEYTNYVLEYYMSEILSLLSEGKKRDVSLNIGNIRRIKPDFNFEAYNSKGLNEILTGITNN